MRVDSGKRSKSASSNARRARQITWGSLLLMLLPAAMGVLSPEVEEQLARERRDAAERALTTAPERILLWVESVEARVKVRDSGLLQTLVVAKGVVLRVESSSVGLAVGQAIEIGPYIAREDALAGYGGPGFQARPRMLLPGNLVRAHLRSIGGAFLPSALELSFSTAEDEEVKSLRGTLSELLRAR